MDGSASRLKPLERLRKLEELGPNRVTGSALEKQAQEKLGAELATLGFKLEWRAHWWTRSIYSGLMAHFGLAVLGTVLVFRWPFVGAALHLFVATSYYLESMRRALLLRGFFPRVQSQNLLATLPAKKTMRRRLVTIAHVDAAFTGLLFNPKLLTIATKKPPKGLGWFHKQLGVGTASVALLGVLGLLAGFGAWAAPAWLFIALSIPATITFLLNLDVTIRNTIVPGAADNLSGCTASVELAHRLVGSLPDDV